MSSRQRKGDRSQKPTGAAAPKKAANKGSNTRSKLEQKVPNRQKIKARPPAMDWERVRNAANQAAAYDRYVQDIPVVGSVYSAGKEYLGKRAKEFVSGILGARVNDRRSIVDMLPATFGVETDQFMKLKQGRAARHEQFPEGGIRLHGEMLHNVNDALGLVASTTRLTAGAWSTSDTTAASNENQFVAISPCAYNTTASGTANNMFGNSSNVVSQISSFHRAFRFRELSLIFEGELGSNSTGSIQFAYDKDPNSMYNRVGAGASQASTATSISTRIPVWTPRKEIVFIKEQKSTISDVLFGCTAANTGVAFGNTAADMKMYFQGAIACLTDVAQTTSVQTFARYRWRFVIDLYGLQPTAADSTIAFGLIDGRMSPELRLAWSRAYEAYYAKKQAEIEDELKKQFAEVEASMEDSLAELIKARDDPLTQLVVPNTGISYASEAKYSSSVPQAVSLGITGFSGDSNESVKLGSEEVKLTGITPSLVIPATVKPVVLTPSPKSQPTLRELEDEISSLRRTYAGILDDQKSRAESRAKDPSFKVAYDAMTDAELEAQRKYVASELEITRDELREFRKRKQAIG